MNQLEREELIQQLCERRKIIHDTIHGDIPLTGFALKFVDNPKFQRLRYLKQLGTCYFVYPNAIHTRFEHSLGTYKNASSILDKICMTYPDKLDDYLALIPELQNYYQRTYQNLVHILDKYICELIKLAALLHDIGHGAFSHVFDDIFIPAIGKKHYKNSTHEERSGNIIEYIIKNDYELSQVIHDDEIQFIKNLINPDEKIHKGFIYQIVSNTLNGLDVDKFDYIVRDTKMLGIQSGFKYMRLIELINIADNNIVYQEQVLHDIYDLFEKRHKLHRLVYSHKGVISSQYIIVELLLALDPILHISDSINNIDDFCKITDNYILESPKFLSQFRSQLNLNEKQEKCLDKALHLINMLDNHTLYAFVDSHSSPTKINMDDFVKKDDPDKDNIIIFQTKVGFVSGNKSNPLDNIYVYKTKDIHNENIIKAYKSKKTDITTLMPTNYQEYITIIFYKDKYNRNKINELKEKFNEYILLN